VKKYQIFTTGKFDNWFRKLDKKTKSIIQDRIFRLQERLWGDYKNIGDGVFELRIFFGAGYRIYFAIDGDSIIIIINGGNKDTQKKDIKKAKELYGGIKNE
jgi:putative addiction module killer protein